MNALFEFLKWLIKLSLAAAAIVFIAVVAFVFGFVSKRRTKKEVIND